MINLEEIHHMIAEGYITAREHPNGTLKIYNYTPSAQYERVWNDSTLACRGLILNDVGEIIARPFKKFFNLSEHRPEEIPNEPFEVFDKLDGSLGILYHDGEKYAIATRGSFVSEQAIRGTAMLHRYDLHRIPTGVTLLFEIIYPSNRIVVNYGNREELVLLAAIDNTTGKDVPLPDIGCSIVGRYDGIENLADLQKFENDADEGFVIRFRNGLRVKVKFSEYLRLHRLLTQCSSKVIWEHLSTNRPLDELLDRVPDEFYSWVRTTQADLLNRYQAIEEQAKSVFRTFDTRKETAMYIMQQEHSDVLFRILDDKDYAPTIWKKLKPEYQKPFRIEE